MIEFRYSLDRPPVMPINREMEFTCSECGRPGWGPPNAVVHPGRCREARTKRLAAEAVARRKRRKEATC